MRSSLVTCAALAKAASVAALSPSSQSKHRLLGASSCTAAPPPASAFFMSTTAGSSSVVDRRPSRPRRAPAARFRRSTATTGSPTWRTLPCARIGCFGSTIGLLSRPVDQPAAWDAAEVVGLEVVGGEDRDARPASLARRGQVDLADPCVGDGRAHEHAIGLVRHRLCRRCSGRCRSGSGSPRDA